MRVLDLPEAERLVVAEQLLVHDTDAEAAEALQRLGWTAVPPPAKLAEYRRTKEYTAVQAELARWRRRAGRKRLIWNILEQTAPEFLDQTANLAAMTALEAILDELEAEEPADPLKAGTVIATLKRAITADIDKAFHRRLRARAEELKQRHADTGTIPHERVVALLDDILGL